MVWTKHRCGASPIIEHEAKELEQLRPPVQGDGGEVKVVKNSLAGRAANEAGKPPSPAA